MLRSVLTHTWCCDPSTIGLGSNRCRFGSRTSLFALAKSFGCWVFSCWVSFKSTGVFCTIGCRWPPSGAPFYFSRQGFREVGRRRSSEYSRVSGSLWISLENKRLSLLSPKPNPAIKVWCRPPLGSSPYRYVPVLPV